jgi:branched-chain amino acid transport system substrate-binding protein
MTDPSRPAGLNPKLRDRDGGVDGSWRHDGYFPDRVECRAQEAFRLAEKPGHGCLRLCLAAPQALLHDRGNRAKGRHRMRQQGRLLMKRLLSGVFASVLAIAATSALAQDKPPLKLGGILDMSSLYADITGAGSETAAKMAAEDFGGEVLGRKIEILAADHQNKADLAANIARDMIDNQGVEMIYDVAASATALAAGEIAKARNKIVIFNGPGSIRLTNEACGPYTVHWVFDTFGQANTTGAAAVKSGLDSWYFLTADYAFGQDLEKDTTNVVLKSGGKVLGSVRHPLNTSDFSSFLLQAQASKAKVIGLANAGGDTVNAIKQGVEFGIMKSGQKMSPLLAFVTDIDSIGLETAQGLLLAEAFYWDLNDDTRAFSKRFMERMKRPPSAAQAGVYSSVTHYLKAVKAAGTTDSAAVMKIMKDTPINDFFAKNGRIREDGRMVHDMYLFEVKKPSESKARWDDYKLLATVPGDQAFQSLELSRCPLVKK